MERKCLKNALYLYFCFYLWVILERVWYLVFGIAPRLAQPARVWTCSRVLEEERDQGPSREISFLRAPRILYLWMLYLEYYELVRLVFLPVCLYFWGLFAPHTSQVLESGEMWEGGALLHKARRCLNEVPPARAADNARCGLVRLRRTTMQSKILDSARQKWRQSGKLRWWISWESEKANGLVFWLFSL